MWKGNYLQDNKNMTCVDEIVVWQDTKHKCMSPKFYMHNFEKQVSLFKQKFIILKNVLFRSHWPEFFVSNPVLMATGQERVFLPYLEPDLLFKSRFAQIPSNHNLATNMKLHFDNPFISILNLA